MAEVRKRGIPVLTDIHEPAQAAVAAEAVDILQIPAFLCRQTDLLLEAGRTGRVVNIKKGQFVSPHDFATPRKRWRPPATSRSCSPSAARLSATTIWWSICAASNHGDAGWPVVFDATHSVQLPGAAASSSGGQPQFIEPLARAAVAVGIAGVFVEVHDNPAKALSDGANSLPLAGLPGFWSRLQQIDALAKAF